MIQPVPGLSRSRDFEEACWPREALLAPSQHGAKQAAAAHISGHRTIGGLVIVGPVVMRGAECVGTTPHTDGLTARLDDTARTR